MTQRLSWRSNTALVTRVLNVMFSKIANSSATERRYRWMCSRFCTQDGDRTGLKLKEYLMNSESHRAPCHRWVCQTPPRSSLASRIV